MNFSDGVDPGIWESSIISQNDFTNSNVCAALLPTNSISDIIDRSTYNLIPDPCRRVSKTHHDEFQIIYSWYDDDDDDARIIIIK